MEQMGCCGGNGGDVCHILLDKDNTGFISDKLNNYSVYYRAKDESIILKKEELMTNLVLPHLMVHKEALEASVASAIVAQVPA